MCHPGLDSESDTEAGGVKGRKAVKEEEQAAEDEASQLVTVSYSTLQCRKAWGDKLCPSSPSEWGDLSISLSHLSVVTPGSASSGLSEAHSRSGSAAPTCASLAQGKRKRLWAGASPELRKKRARGTRNDPSSGRSEDYTEMTLKALRDLADKTPGMKKQKKRSSKSG